MNRDEFLRILREALTMSLEQDAVNEQLDYYDKYISDEIKKGRSEKEVLDELGDPRLIAKTIKTVNNTNSVGNENFDSNSNYNSGSNTNNSYNNNSYNRKSTGQFYNLSSTSGTIGCVILLLVLFIIFMAVLRFFGYVAYGLGSLAFSGSIGFVIVLLLLFFFFGNRRK